MGYITDKWVKITSVNRKILLIVLPPVIIVATVFLYLIGHIEAGYRRAQAQTAINRFVEAHALAVSDAVWNFAESSLNDMLIAINHQPGVHCSLIMDNSGAVFTANQKGCSGRPDTFGMSHPIKRKERDQEIEIGELTVVFRDSVLERQAPGQLLSILLLTAALVGIVTLTAVFAIRLTMGKPLSRVKASLTAFRNSGVRQQVDYVSGDELGQFVAEYNATLERQQVIEQALREARDSAEEASRAKGDFVANMSHEIRTPMNAIVGMTHLCLQTDLTDRQRGYLEKIDGAGKALLGIVNDILDFSKIEAGKLDMEAIDFRLEDVLDDLATLVGMKARDKGLELLFDTDPDAPMALIGDPLRLGQVLVNLANNATKFTDKGEVVVATELLEADEARVRLRFSVRDTGIGLSDEQKTRLFQAFSQADSTTTRKYGGTGLGLAICKRLVAMMNGEIGVRSELGVGSTFYFTAEFGRQQGEAEPMILTPTPDLQGMRVLVVDDNASAREILTSMLELFGFQVSSAKSGQETIEQLHGAVRDEDPFKLVLMDWKMPGMDGAEAVRRIRSDPVLSASTAAIIMVTAYGREEASQDTRPGDLDGLLIKPVNPSVLFDAVMEAFGKAAPRRARRAARRVEELEAVNQLRGSRILLVEDNELNQEVALELLDNAGIVASVAENGKLALEALESGAFDGVLMDVQMPVMDGFEATRAIRNQLQRADLPVIAMTANAMAGDRERCLEAGMNDHIAKPIDVHEMFSTLAKWVKPSQVAVTKADAVESQTREDVDFSGLQGIDLEAGLRRVMGNRRRYRKLLWMFRDGQQDFAAQFAAARADNDRERATRLAHTLKGVAGNIGADAVQSTAQALEAAVKADHPEAEVDALLAQVRKALDATIDTIEAWSAETAVAIPEAAAPHSASKSLDVTLVSALMGELAELLADGDTAAGDHLERLQAALAETGHAHHLETVTRYIESYDFDEALAALREVGKVLGIALDEA